MGCNIVLGSCWELKGSVTDSVFKQRTREKEGGFSITVVLLLVHDSFIACLF